MNLRADLGQAVAYSHLLSSSGVPLHVAHAAFEASIEQQAAGTEPRQVLSAAEKRAALAAGMRARGEDRAAAAMAGLV